MKPLYLALGALFVLLTSAIALWRFAVTAPDQIVYAKTLFQVEKPIQDWYVCADMGVGPVPGLTEPRQRFRLCHLDGWRLRAYCLQPNLPAPPVGTVCTRISDDTYSCGNGIQNLREYAVLDTPSLTLTATTTPSQTPTASPTYTATPSPSPTATSTRTPTITQTPPPAPSPTPTDRTVPGGSRYWLKLGLKKRSNATATSTPFQPQTATPLPAQATSHPPIKYAQHQLALPKPSFSFYGIDFNDSSQRIHIRIQPPDRRVNGGKPIVISFFPGQTCEYGDQRACVTAFRNSLRGETTFITVHSGVGAEGQAYRHAVEGTGYNRAVLSLRKVQENLGALEGSDVTIVQGAMRIQGLRLVAAPRVPATAVDEYFRLPVDSALGLVSSIDHTVAGYVNSDQPQLVFETCGWKIPGESGAKGLSNNSASVYLGVIQLNLDPGQPK